MGGGVPQEKIFFCQSEHVSSQIWFKKFFPLLRPGTPPPWKSETWDPPKNLTPGTPPKNLTPGTPPENLRPGTSPKNLRPGTSPLNRHTPVKT